MVEKEPRLWNKADLNVGSIIKVLLVTEFLNSTFLSDHGPKEFDLSQLHQSKWMQYIYFPLEINSLPITRCFFLGEF